MSEASRTDKTAAERQRRKRQRDAANGWAYVRVRVPADRADEVRTFAESLGEPAAKALPGQAALPFD